MTQTEQFPAQCAAQESAAPDDEPQFDMQQVLQDNARLNQAILFATERHAGQLRKGTVLPYILHPLETMQILSNMQADINLQIAGLLHDTIEDTDTTAAEIAALFGDDVAALVNHHSEDKSKSWLERKTQALTALQTADDRLKMLVNNWAMGFGSVSTRPKKSRPGITMALSIRWPSWINTSKPPTPIRSYSAFTKTFLSSTKSIQLMINCIKPTPLVRPTV